MPVRPRSGVGGMARVMLIMVAGFLGCQSVYAEAIGSPASILKKGKWSFGLAGGSVLGRSLKGDAEAVVYHGGHFRGYGLTDWLSVYAKLGAAHIEVEDPSIRKRNDPSTANSFGASVLATIQMKGKLFESKTRRWEWDGSLHYVDMRARRKEKNEGRWHEWQLATSLAKPFGRLKPYAGVAYSVVDFSARVREDGVTIQGVTYEQDHPLGVFMGTDFYLGRLEDTVINIETSYLDGAEVSMAISYQF